MTMMKKSR